MEIFSATPTTTPYATRSHIPPSSLPKGWYLPTAFTSLLPIPNQSWVMAPTIRAIGFFHFFEIVSELNRQFHAQFSPKPNSDHQAFQRNRIHPGENFHPSCPSSTNLDLFLLKHGIFQLRYNVQISVIVKMHYSTSSFRQNQNVNHWKNRSWCILCLPNLKYGVFIYVFLRYLSLHSYFWSVGHYHHCLLPTYLPTSPISVRDSFTFSPPNSLRWSLHMYTQGF